MCLAVVYGNSGDGKKEAMQDVIRIEAENRGYRLVSLLGEEKLIEGRLKVVDFLEEHSVVIEPDGWEGNNGVGDGQDRRRT